MSEQTRTALLDAAEEAFRADPYSRVSVARVADRAHVSVGTIYHHVGDKEGLRAAVVERVINRLLVDYLRPALSADGPPAERLLGAALAFVRCAEERAEDFRLLQATQHDLRESEHSRRITARIVGQVGAVLQETATVVREGQAAGEVGKGDPARRVLLVWSALYGMCTLVTRYPGPARAVTGERGVEGMAEGLVRQLMVLDEPA